MGLEAAMFPSMMVGTTLLVSRRGMTTPRLALPMKRLVVRLSSALNSSPTSSPSSRVCGFLPSSLKRTRWRKQPLWRIVLLPSLMLLRVEARPACPCMGRLSRCSSWGREHASSSPAGVFTLCALKPCDTEGAGLCSPGLDSPPRKLCHSDSAASDPVMTFSDGLRSQTTHALCNCAIQKHAACSEEQCSRLRCVLLPLAEILMYFGQWTHLSCASTRGKAVMRSITSRLVAMYTAG